MYSVFTVCSQCVCVFSVCAVCVQVVLAGGRDRYSYTVQLQLILMPIYSELQ